MMQETEDERLQKLSNRISLKKKGPMETMGRRMCLDVHNRQGVGTLWPGVELEELRETVKLQCQLVHGLSPAHFFPSVHQGLNGKWHRRQNQPWVRDQVGWSKFLTPWSLRVLVCKRERGPSQGFCEEQRKLFPDSFVTVIPFLAKITIPSSVVSSPWLRFLPCQMVRALRGITSLSWGAFRKYLLNWISFGFYRCPLLAGLYNPDPAPACFNPVFSTINGIQHLPLRAQSTEPHYLSLNPISAMQWLCGRRQVYLTSVPQFVSSSVK